MKRLFASAALLLWSTASSAQESASVRAIGATAFGNMAATPMIGAGLTFDRDDVIQLFGEAALEPDTARGVAGGSSDPGGPAFGVVSLVGDEVTRIDRYALGGLRLRRVTESRVAPYIEFGGGAARRTSELRPYPSQPASGFTYFLASAGGGIFARLTETIGIEAGYRYGFLLRGNFTDSMNKVYAAVAFKLY